MANIEDDDDSSDSSEDGEAEIEAPKRKLIATLKVWGHSFFLQSNIESYIESDVEVEI